MTFCCDAVLFDMDGTLVDSRIACENLLRSWAGRHGLNAELISAAVQGRTNRDIVREFTPQLPADEEGARLDQEELLYREGNFAVPGALPVLSALPAGSWALVTSASGPVAEMRLECSGLPRPAVLISSDDVRQGKPDPEGYLKAAERLGVKPERCLVIEDTPTGLEAARRAGMEVLAITTTFPAAHLNAAICIADFTCLEIGQTELAGKPRLCLRVNSGHNG
ncbi:MAG: HAD-IA family hydrolase [Bryobacteraceae bacterium]